MHYTYRVQWSPQHRRYVARCIEFPGIDHTADDPHEALRRLTEQIELRVDEIRSTGDEPPEALTDHHYSGRFLVRTSPELHASWVIRAAEEGLSLNQWVVQTLAQRPVIPDGR
ncbi:type II toxin-antitoxin system HicB family antitoxin [Mycobacterium sp. MYCO198283]|uniref:type II toxin-antitoxin system HicB family antitoxin n=1 Tax=Mycobacterium sp. MYCO198283 TaxID=2883505 RepID=UPI001E2D72B0|nr:type II toxin-antitoxin system HicB family antitoxin [Mycobacterium sp. MYCO198283]MCG5432413.1 type II toxin-antitoxin system HicB family antitoxin [Mycobacterium sp. MYCO198283]